MRCLLSALLLLMPLFSHSAGSWSVTRAGGQLHVGGQIVTSPSLTPPRALPAGSQVTRIHWRITLLPAAPAGFQVKLCSVQRCVPLSGMRGSWRPEGSWLAQGPFRFVYHVAGKGPLLPRVSVVSNQLSIDYQ